MPKKTIVITDYERETGTEWVATHKRVITVEEPDEDGYPHTLPFPPRNPFAGSVFGDFNSMFVGFESLFEKNRGKHRG